MYALDAATGDLIWRNKIYTTMYSPPLVADGFVYATTFDRALFALDALTGEIIWHDKMPGTKLPAFMDKVGELLIFETFPRHWIPPPEQWLGISRKTSSQPEE